MKKIIFTFILVVVLYFSSTTPVQANIDLSKAFEILNAIFNPFYDESSTNQVIEPSVPIAVNPVDVENINTLIDSYGLDPAQEAGLTGYRQLATSITSLSNAKWFVDQLLDAEKKLSVQNRYLPTAWLWIESYAGYPDPYLVNCHDSPDLNLKQSVAEYCPATRRITTSLKEKNDLFQVAGFQMQDKVAINSLYVAYKKVSAVYNENLESLMNDVIDNSEKASVPLWRYKVQLGRGLVQTYLPDGRLPDGKTIPKVSEADIARSKPQLFSEANPRSQFYTALLGKHPGMSIYLNNQTLESQNFIGALRSDRCLYSKDPMPDTASGCYYNKAWKQKLSNMVAALYLIETQKDTIDSGTNPGTDTTAPILVADSSSVVEWTKAISSKIQKSDSKACGGRYCKLIEKISSNNYTSSYRTGADDSTSDTGLYWCTTRVVDSFNLAGYSGLKPGTEHEGVTQMIQFFRAAQGYTYIDYQRSSSKKETLSQIKPGCAMFQESVHGTHTGNEHASIVTDIHVDEHGNGSISTNDSNASKTEYKFQIVDGLIMNWSNYPYKSFGCKV